MEEGSILFTVIQLIVLGGSFIVGKYIVPKLSKKDITTITDKINLVINYADAFVTWAKKFMQDSTGEEKMAEVVRQLTGVAEKYNIDISEKEIQAIAQRAYEQMKATAAANQAILLESAPIADTVTVAPLVNTTDETVDHMNGDEGSPIV